MAKRTYRTAAGKAIDIEQLRLKNEEVPAVGNMRVNARGDELSPNGTVIKSRSDSIGDQYYNVHSNVPQESAVADPASEKMIQPDNTTTVKSQPDEISPAVQTEVQQDPAPAVSEPVSRRRGGLAAATAGQQTKSTEPLKSAREQDRATTGVKRI